jgi:hypothetical protein
MNKIIVCIVLLVFLSACNGSLSTTNNQAATPPPPVPTASRSPLTGFEAGLQYIRNGSYTYIWVFARKDGKVLDKEDGAFLRKNAPQVVDWVTTDEGRKVIGGTNFNLEEGNLELIKKRFISEDYTGR